MIRVVIDELMKQRELSVYKLAKETNITYSMLWRIVNNKTNSISFEYIDRICEALDCQPGDLMVKVGDGKKVGNKNPR